MIIIQKTMRDPSWLRWMVTRTITMGGLVILSVTGLALAGRASAAPAQQPPTGSIPTVTGTPVGTLVVVPDQVNVRTGPSTEYELIGVLIAGQTAPAIGRTAGGDWIQIAYAGVPNNVAWVYSPFVVLDPPGGFLPIIEPPPTATPRVTPTIDPTLAAQFNLSDITATRLPTFTAAPPIVQPTLAPPQLETSLGIPPILTIAGLVLIGTFGVLISVLRGS
ncbi:MAG: hypothetical protein BMS9Abin28_2322 [Anaerolineae bacterium]|nr:MAG: hypothetical protein BMS9Abin28_2322 [Anaerolineae bacterium]